MLRLFWLVLLGFTPLFSAEHTTTNFRVVAPTQELAQSAGRLAEEARGRISEKWLGKTPAWDTPCALVLHQDAPTYARLTGQPQQCPGHSTISNDGGRVLTRRIDLRLDDPTVFSSVLPHEICHVVLAGQFGPKHIPRWADEGMAVLSEPPERLQMHTRNLPTHRRGNQLFAVSQLMKMMDYPPPHLTGVFYAQSASLTHYLVNQKGPEVFAQFLREEARKGPEFALQASYGVSIAELEQGWTNHAFGGTTQATVQSGPSVFDTGSVFIPATATATAPPAKSPPIPPPPRGNMGVPIAAPSFPPLAPCPDQH